jgi:hypothetical protein
MILAIDADMKKTAFDKNPDIGTLVDAYTLDRKLIVDQANAYLTSAADMLKKHHIHPEKLNESDYGPQELGAAVAAQKNLIAGVVRNNVNLQLYGTGEGTENEKAERLVLRDYAIQEMNLIAPPPATPSSPQDKAAQLPARKT